MRGRAVAMLLVLASACGSSGGESAPPAPPAPQIVAETSRPSPATIAALQRLDGPLTALSFVAEGPARDQVYGYLQDLAARSGKPIEIRELDRLGNPVEAERHKVARDDILVLTAGEVSERLTVRASSRLGRLQLLTLDGEVGAALAKLGLRQRRTAVILAGGAGPPRTLLEQVLRALGYHVTAPASAEPLPADVHLVVLLDAAAPAVQAVDQHLARGGAALIALEPAAGVDLGPLGARLGLRLDVVALADDHDHLTRTRSAADHAALVTGGFAVHAITATLSRVSAGTGALFMSAGSLEALPGAPAPLFAVRSGKHAFRDLNRNLTFDEGEQRAEYAIAAVVEPGAGARAVVYADADWLSDPVLGQLATHQALLADSLRWLGGDAELAEVTRTDAGAADVTAYPLRPARPASASPSLLWSERAEDITEVTLVTPARTVTVTRRDGYLWGRVERRAATGGEPQAREFAVSEAGDALLAALAAPRTLRALGPVDAAARAERGLDSDERLTVRLGERTRELVLGGRVYGGADRYVADGAGAAFVVTGALLRPLEGAESALALRNLLPLAAADITAVAVEAGGHTREVPMGGELARALIERAQRLAPIDFTTVEPAGLRSLAVLRFRGPAGAEAELELLAADAEGRDIYFARTASTHGLARLSLVAAETFARAVEQAAAQ